MKDITVEAFLQSFENPFQPVVVNEGATIMDVVKTMVEHKEERAVFVVDDDGRLRGVISAGRLARHIVHEEVSPHTGFLPSANILHYLTAEHARDIMECNVLSCRMDELLSTATGRMFGKTIYKMLPVVDEEGQILGLLNVLDILDYGFD